MLPVGDGISVSVIGSGALQMRGRKMELLAPAGDLEKLKIAADYGADAVYFGGELFSLRAGAGNLTVEEIEEAVEYLHLKAPKAT